MNHVTTSLLGVLAVRRFPFRGSPHNDHGVCSVPPRQSTLRQVQEVTPRRGTTNNNMVHLVR